MSRRGSHQGGLVTLPGPPRVGFWLYLITDGVFEVRQGQQLVPTPLEGRLCSALSAVPRGMVAVQLRARQMDAGALLSAADRLRQLTARFGAPLFINDRLDVALLVEADGVHLPAAGLPPRAARRLVGTRMLLGSSTHNLAEARAAVTEGVDFVTFGPIWPTPSKPALDVAAFPPVHGSLVSPVGVAGLAEAVAALPVPVFALGGVDCIERARECIAAGARIACLRAVLGAQDPAATARALFAVCSGELNA
ncbi:MAG: thiamine phosphate synthase [Myxococcales bacterium]|nr:thiamine phosphate synthase [Myxococcota bacterium]MDW8281847.1 thiamine phosphate synthase [Myxococcales bacterium]